MGRDSKDLVLFTVKGGKLKKLLSLWLVAVRTSWQGVNGGVDVAVVGERIEHLDGVGYGNLLFGFQANRSFFVHKRAKEQFALEK